MWLEIQKAVGLGLLNSLAIKVETELQERERWPKPQELTRLTLFLLGVKSSVWLLNNISITGLFSCQWEDGQLQKPQEVVSISRG